MQIIAICIAGNTHHFFVGRQQNKSLPATNLALNNNFSFRQVQLLVGDQLTVVPANTRIY